MYQNIQNEIAAATKDTVIDTYKANLTKLDEEITQLINNNEITEASKKHLIEINANIAASTAIEAALKRSGINLNNAQIRKLNAEITRLNKQTEIDINRLNLDKFVHEKDFEFKYNQLTVNTIANSLGIKAEQFNNAMRVLGNILGNVGGASILAQGARGLKTTTTTTQTVNKPVYDTNTGQVINRRETTSTSNR